MNSTAKPEKQDSATKAVKSRRKSTRKSPARKRAKAVKASSQGRGSERRKAIIWALRSCMIKKGYAKTTLADVAEVAELYPSHLLYYFDGKDEILQQFFQNVAAQIVQRLESFQVETPRRQIDLLVDLFFAGTSITKSEIGLMLECFGIAVNDRALRYEKEKLDAKCKVYLEALLEQTPCGFLPGARDSAEVAYATLIGLRAAIYFDNGFELDDGKRLFHAAMLRIAGLEPEQ